jgi:hypothetical protein
MELRGDYSPSFLVHVFPMWLKPSSLLWNLGVQGKFVVIAYIDGIQLYGKLWIQIPYVMINMFQRVRTSILCL